LDGCECRGLAGRAHGGECVSRERLRFHVQFALIPNLTNLWCDCYARSTKHSPTQPNGLSRLDGRRFGNETGDPQFGAERWRIRLNFRWRSCRGATGGGVAIAVWVRWHPAAANAIAATKKRE